MDNDLDRSVRLLEDALKTPTKGLFKLSTTGLRHQKLTDDTMALAPEELQMLAEAESRVFSDTIQLLGNKSMIGSVVQGGSPWTNTVDNLYTEFADTLQGCSGNVEMLEVVKDLARCCSDALAVINSLKAKVAVGEIPEEKWLENEKSTWRLIYVLYNDRLQAEQIEQQPANQYSGHSEKNCVDELFKKDNLVRESQLVIDWLERSALDRDDPILHYSDSSYGWENTLHQLFAPDSIAIGSTVDIIDNIHPDAPHSQELSLHHLDSANDKKLCQRIFMEIRCGNLEGAQEYCFTSGHPWRAALLEGWKLYHNPYISENGDVKMDDGSDYQDVEGNSNRHLWKFAALEFCKKPYLDIHEKAAVASLCGFLEGILPVCNNWEDFLWAYMRTMIDKRVESEIRDCIPKNYKPLPEEYWEEKLSLDDIFKILETINKQAVASESQLIDHLIQKYIILDDIPALMNTLEQYSENPTVTTQSLRYFAHLVLFLESVGQTTDRKAYEKIIEAYINHLGEMNETQLVAFYVSKLGKRKQIYLYAKYCEKLLTTDDRKAALRFAEDCNLDVFAITECIVERIINLPTETDNAGNLQKKLTAVDEVKISSLDWLMFYEEQRVEALNQTNSLVFKFLLIGKLDAAQLAVNKIPSDSIGKIKSEGEISDEIDLILQEFLSYKTYLDAHEAFNEWFTQFRNKPNPPPELPSNAHFTEKVAHNHKVSQFSAEMERWKLTTSHTAKTATTLLYNVLLFPQGWLKVREDAEYLRAICIPQIVLLLCSVLQESSSHEEAVQLADLIASEKYSLYKVYSKEKLGEILEKICESSVALLNAKKDPFGNPSTA